MVEIWYIVVDWTNLQLIVLKILMVVSCDEKYVVGIRWKICSWVFLLWSENGHQKYFVRWLRFGTLQLIARFEDCDDYFLWMVAIGDFRNSYTKFESK